MIHLSYDYESILFPNKIKNAFILSEHIDGTYYMPTLIQKNILRNETNYMDLGVDSNVIKDSEGRLWIVDTEFKSFGDIGRKLFEKFMEKVENDNPDYFQRIRRVASLIMDYLYYHFTENYGRLDAVDINININNNIGIILDVNKFI